MSRKLRINILVAAICIAGVVGSAIIRQDFGQVVGGLAAGGVVWVLVSFIDRLFVEKRSLRSPSRYYAALWFAGFLALFAYFVLTPSLYPDLWGIKILICVFGSAAIVLSGYFTTKSKGTSLLPWRRKSNRKSPRE